MLKDFEGKVALVTGGSFGIGRATAIAFAKKGAKVVIADLVDDKDSTTLHLINALGVESFFVHCDVSSGLQVSSLIDQVISRFGRLDFAFNNAGIEGVGANTHECSEENWDNTINVNLKGVWLCMKNEIPHMLNIKKGVIVNCSSVAGLGGYAGLPSYAASKHGVVGLTKSASLEYAAHGIRVNAVCPGVIHTPMVDRLTGKDKAIEKKYESMEPIGRMGTPEEVAEAVVWLCSDAASFVTGIAMPVDGGYAAG